MLKQFLPNSESFWGFSCTVSLSFFSEHEPGAEARKEKIN